jgi:hypothetical protein
MRKEGFILRVLHVWEKFDNFKSQGGGKGWNSTAFHMLNQRRGS